jgi:uncharacterized protein (TIGR03435 family)
MLPGRAQPADEKPLAFDAASMKPVFLMGGAAGRGVQPKQPGARRVLEKPTGGPGTSDPGRIHYPAVTLEFLLMNAWAVNNYQIDGPAWMKSERFDIDATMPAGTTREQLRGMLQNLLSERLKLAMHRETRDLPGYSLVVAKGAPKFKESAVKTASTSGDEPDPPLKPGPDGYFVAPARPGIFVQMTRPPGARATYREVTMQALAESLQNQLRRPVSGATGLKGQYSFVLDFSTEGVDLGSGRIPVSAGDLEDPPNIFSALQSQLGLKLEPKKGPVPIIVIDHVEKTPTEN